MDSVVPLLVATRANEKSIRAEAEQQVGKYFHDYPQEFMLELLKVAGDPNTQVADGQSALLVLKRCIFTTWSPGFDLFVGPPLSHETRQVIRQGLIQLLSSAGNAKIRSACALVIANIGSLEYPDQWPDLVLTTVSMLNDSQPLPVLGGLVLFKELLLETLREEDFMQLGEQILARLLTIAEKGDEDTQLLAIQSFHECITFLLMGDDDQLPELDETAARFIPQWISFFCQLFADGGRNSEIIQEIVSTVNEVESAFPQVVGPHLHTIYDVSVSLLLENTTLDQELKSNVASLLETALQNADARRRALGSGPRLDQFTSLLLSLATIPQELADWWLDDYNEFVTAELELDPSELNPRDNAGSLVAMSGQPAILPRLLDMLHSVTAVAELEAVLFLLSNLLTQVDIDKHLVVVDFARLQEFLQVLQFGDVENQKHGDLLTARKVLTAGVVAKYSGSYLPNEIKLQLVKHAFQVPDAGPEMIRVAQVRTIVIGSELFPGEFKPHQIESLRLIASLIESADDDTPLFLTESYGSILKLDFELAAHQSFVIEILFALASKDTADVDLNAQILDVIGEIMTAVSSRTVVDHILRPVLATINSSLASSFEYTSDLYFALDLATAVFEHPNVELSASEREQMLQSFYSVITTTQDPQILQVASFAYAALVQNLQSDISTEAAQNVLRVAAQLLDPSLDDSAALASGKLVSAIIDRFGNELGDILTELIEASAKRLATAENALLVETLVLVFCDLTLRNASAVVDILARSNLLEPVMRQWVPTFEVVRGADEIRKNVLAFQKLFDLNDPRLNDLMLPDEPIRNPNEILTRRKAKNLKFTQIPMPLKILKLLIRELSQSAKPPADQELASEDEWADELALNDEGEVLDYRTFNLILSWFKKLGQQGMHWFSQLNSNERQVLMEASRGD